MREGTVIDSELVNICASVENSGDSKGLSTHSLYLLCQNIKERKLNSSDHLHTVL